MAIEPRAVDLRVRALLDQGLAPLDQVVTKLEAANKALQSNADLNKSAAANEKAYSDALKASATGLTEAIRLRAELAALSQKQTQADKAAAELTARQSAAKNAQDAFGGGSPTQAQTQAIETAQAGVKRQQAAVEQVNAELRQQLELVQRLGLLSKEAGGSQLGSQIEAANQRLDELLTKNSRVFEQGKNSQSEFVARLQQSLALQEQLAAIDARRVQLGKEQAAAIRQAVQAAQDEAIAAEKVAQARAKAITRADAATTANAAQRDALTGQAPLPPPTATASVSAALAPPPGSSSTVLALQSEVDRLSKIFATAGSGTHVYAQALRDLDAVYKELDRQASVVTGFQAQVVATNAAGKAYREATDAVARLKAALATANPEQIGEISSRIDTLQRQIGSDTGSGFAGRFAREREALAQETDAAEKLGVTVNTIGEAYVRLTGTAVQAAETRTAAVKREQAETISAINAAKAKAEELAKGLVGGGQAVRAPTLQETVSSLVPGRNDPKDIDNVGAAIDGLTDKMGKGRLTAQTYNEVMDQVFAIQKKLVTDATLINQFKEQEAAVQKARQAFLEENAALTALSDKAKTSAVSLREVNQANANVASAADKLRQEQQALAGVSAQLKQRKIDTDNINQAEKDLIATTLRLAEATKGVQQSAGTAFGLSAFQVQNLGFQVNDVITQLSLGQGVFRTLAAQGGQIFQIFDLSLATLKEFAVALAAVGPPLILFGLSLERIQQTQAAQRAFAGQLAGSVNVANTTATALSRLQRELEKTGADFTELGKALALFTSAGLSTDQIDRFARSAQNLAQGTGKSLTDTSKALASIVTTGDPGRLLEIAKDYGVLTEGLVNYVNAQVKAGEIGLAQQAVLDALATRGKAAKDVAISPLTQAIIDLTNAWHDFLDTIGSADTFLLLVGSTKDLVQSFTNLFQAVQGGAPDFASFSRAILDVDGKLKNLILPFPGLQNDLLKFFGILDRKPGTLLDATKAKVVDLTAAYNAAKVKADEMAADPRTSGSSWLENQKRLADDLKTKLDEAIALKTKLEQPGGLGVNATPGKPGAVSTDTSSVVAPAAGTNLAAGNVIATGLVQRGMALGDALAFAANALRESGGDPTKVNNDPREGPGGSHGLFQINKERLTAFKAANNGQAPEQAGMQAQLDFVIAEVTGKFKDAYEEIKRTGSIEDKARVVTRRYEIPADPTGEGNKSAGIARALAGNSFQTPTTARDTIDPNSPTGRAANAETLNRLNEDLEKQRTDAASIVARGFSKQAQDLDALYAKKVDEDTLREYTAANKGIKLSQAAEDARQEVVIGLLQKRAADRQREDDEDRIKLENSISSARKQVDDYKKANHDLDAAERSFREAAVPKLNAALDAQKKGQTTFEGQPTQDIIDSLNKGIDQGAQQARADTAKAGFDAAESILKSLVAGAEEEFKNGSISLATMFQRIADAVKENAPKIKEAQSVALDEIAKSPASSKNVASTAALRAADVTGRTALQGGDDVGFADIQKLVAARDAQIKTVKDLLSRDAIGGREADSRIQDAFSKTAPAINKEITALQTQLDLQKQLNLIEPAYYEKQSAALRKLAGETSDLTQLQKDLDRGFENAVTGRTIQALDAVGTAIAGVIQGTLTWKQGIAAVGTAFAQAALGILKDLSTIIIKEELLNAIKAAGGLSGIVKSIIGLVGAVAGGAAGGGGFGADSGAISAAETASSNADIAWAQNLPVRHAGGTIGDVPLMRRAINLPSHVNATWMHSGGIVGLKPNEQLTVMENGERVVSNAQQRQDKAMQNAWKNAPPQNISAVVALTPEHVTEAMLNTPAGNRFVLLTLKRNAPEAKSVLGVK